MMSVFGMMISVMIAGASPAADALVDEAQEYLLAGESLPASFHHKLKAVEPLDRYAVVIWLRRSGLLTGPEIPIETMLAPPDLEGSQR